MPLIKPNLAFVIDKNTEIIPHLDTLLLQISLYVSYQSIVLGIVYHIMISQGLYPQAFQVVLLYLYDNILQL